MFESAYQERINLNMDDFPSLEADSNSNTLTFEHKAKNKLDQKFNYKKTERAENPGNKKQILIEGLEKKNNFPAQQVLKDYENDLKSFPLIDQESSFKPRNFQEQQFKVDSF